MSGWVSDKRHKWIRYYSTLLSIYLLEIDDDDDDDELYRGFQG